MLLETRERKWVLIVDDEQEIRESLREVISLQFGKKVEVVEARDGVEATSKINFQKFDCIITDLSMPRKEGEPFIYSIRSNPLNETTPVIIVSGSNQIQKVSEKFEFVDRIEKPYKMSVLVDLLSTHLERGDNKNRVSASVFNNLVESLQKFVKEVAELQVEQQGALKVKERGEEFNHDFVSSIQVKIGKVTNTFSILANKSEVESLFSGRGRVDVDHLIQSMCFVILRNVLEKAQSKTVSGVKGSFLQQDKSLLARKKGIILDLGSPSFKIHVFATSQ